MYSGIDDFLQLLGGIHVCRVTRNLFLLYPMYILEIDNVLQLVNQVLPQVQLLVGNFWSAVFSFAVRICQRMGN